MSATDILERSHADPTHPRACRPHFLACAGIATLTELHHGNGAETTYQLRGKNRFRRGGSGTPDTFYDNSGNMLRTGQQPNGSPALTWTWDSLGMAVDHSVYEGSVGQTYTYPQIYGPGNYRLLTLDSGRGLREYTLRDLGGKVLRLWEVRGWGSYQGPSTPGQQMTFVKDYLHGAEGVFGSWGNGGVKRFFHNDHLGSPRLITGDDGANPFATLATRYYYPYGTDFGSGGPHDDRISKFTSHERDIPRRTDHMLARTYATPLQRFLSPDPGRDGWNLYTYVANNPLNATDPDGLKDRRTVEDKAILGDPDVMAGVAAVIRETNLDKPLAERQEAGIVVAAKDGGDFEVEGEVVTQGKLNKVELKLSKLPSGEIVTPNGQELAATVHSHPGTGEVKIDGERSRLYGGAPSGKDREQVKVTGKPLYIFNARDTLIKVEPTATGGTKATTILTGKDYDAYLDAAGRARSEQP